MITKFKENLFKKRDSLFSISFSKSLLCEIFGNLLDTKFFLKNVRDFSLFFVIFFFFNCALRIYSPSKCEVWRFNSFLIRVSKVVLSTKSPIFVYRVEEIGGSKKVPDKIHKVFNFNEVTISIFLPLCWSPFWIFCSTEGKVENSLSLCLNWFCKFKTDPFSVSLPKFICLFWVSLKTLPSSFFSFFPRTTSSKNISPFWSE